MKRIFILTITIALLGAACAKKSVNQNTSTVNQSTGTSLTNSTNSDSHDTPSGTASVSWSFNGTTWQSSGTPPACPEPLTIRTPVDLSTATAILYPGQTRGGNYKPHGGFRFDVALDNEKSVIAPMDATLVNGSRYLEQGETQYLLTFINPCGIAFRFDHLLTLSPAMQAIAETLPAAKADDSRTTNFPAGPTVKAGDVIATEIGFRNTRNVSVDFGLYDLRTTNGTTRDAEYGQHGLCWFNNLTASDAATAKSLPAGDQTAGKTSDYCSS